MITFAIAVVVFALLWIMVSLFLRWTDLRRERQKLEQDNAWRPGHKQ